MVRGVGRERQQQLERLQIRTIGDLLFHGPRRYEDRRQVSSIREVVQGQAITVRGSVIAAGVKKFRGGFKSVFEVVLDDGTARLHCRWWNQPYMERFFAVGDQLFAHGKPTSLKPRAMDHPETEKITDDGDEQVHLNRIVPVYPSTEGLTQRALRLLVWRGIEEFAAVIGEPTPTLVPNPPSPIHSTPPGFRGFPDPRRFGTCTFPRPWPLPNRPGVDWRWTSLLNCNW